VPAFVGSVVTPAVPALIMVCPETESVPLIVEFPAPKVPVVNTGNVPKLGTILVPKISAVPLISASSIVPFAISVLVIASLSIENSFTADKLNAFPAVYFV
jgi:hypothetical protein